MTQGIPRGQTFQHTRATYTLDGSLGLGSLNDICQVLTVKGTVKVWYWTMYCSSTLDTGGFGGSLGLYQGDTVTRSYSAPAAGTMLSASPEIATASGCNRLTRFASIPLILSESRSKTSTYGEFGTATGVTHTTLSDATKSWATNQWVGATAVMGGKQLVITSNNANALTGAAGWVSADPAGVDVYSVGNAVASGFSLRTITHQISDGTLIFDVFWEPISPGATVTARTKYSQPFPLTSIWNRPIMNTAVYVAASIPDATGPNYINIDENIINLDYTASSQTTRTYADTGDWCTLPRCGNGTADGVSVPWPATWFVPVDLGNCPNNPGALIKTDGDTILQTQPIHRCSGNRITYLASNTPTSMSISTGNGIDGSHGGSSMNAFGGAIRSGELVPGGVINHAMKIELNAEQALAFNKTTGSAWTITDNTATNPTVVTINTNHPFVAGDSVTIAGSTDSALNGVQTVVAATSKITFTVAVAAAGGTGGTAKKNFAHNYRWPATNSDTLSPGGSVPECRYGSLLALKQGFDFTTITTEPGYILARAAQIYGFYVVDSTSDDPVRAALVIERNPQIGTPHNSVRDEFKTVWGYPINYWYDTPIQNSFHQAWIDDIHTIIDNLYVVDNNGSATIGGGVPFTYLTGIAPYAPPIT